jgi:hypothetical protein
VNGMLLDFIGGNYSEDQDKKENKVRRASEISLH